MLLSTALRKRELPRRVCLWLAIAILLICGNGWLAKYSTRYLERQYQPLEVVEQAGEITETSLTTNFIADCILVLGGGTLPKLAPRPTVEVAEAGDRVLYGAHLFLQHKAPVIMCSGRSS